MQRKLMRMTGAGLACIPLLLAGCGEMNVKKYLPFGGDAVQERPRTPANATEYQCAAGKRFYVRTLEGGAAVWLILPERELRLEKRDAESGLRYGNGIALLEINGSDATLKDGATVSFAGCKTASSDPK
ncbi:MAG: MliC family protein [Rhodocyclales bacterium]|nr:MliC family protein [Rhodocyclales bacterium]